MKKIAVVGTGYVGLSNAVLLAQHNEVLDSFQYWMVDKVIEEINTKKQL